MYLTTKPVKEYIAFREPIPEERWSIAAAPTSSPLQAAFRRTQILFFLILGGALALGIMGTILISRNITRPIAQLAQATQRFATGNLESNIPVQSADEIGALTADFNTMASDLRKFLRERQTNETLLAIGRVSSSLVHDLRNPIEGLKLLSTELLKRIELGRDELEVADTIHQSAERLSSLLTQSLNFARLTHPEFSPTNIVALADEALQDIRATGVEIRRTYDPHVPLIEVDAVQIKRVLSNILLNAVEACRNNPAKSPGVVELLLRAEKTKIRIEIADNGSGIPLEQREKIFEPFFSTKLEGHGLGLSFARQILKNHGGELVLTSEVGKGTRFIASIPIHQKVSGMEN
jgi:two-component system NtrC family sensor kinase